MCVFLKLRGPEAPVPSALVSPRGSRTRLNWWQPRRRVREGILARLNGQDSEACIPPQAQRRCKHCAPAARAAESMYTSRPNR